MQYRVVFAFFVLAANAVGARGYVLDREHNGLRPGDSMKLRQIEYADTVSAGEWRLWDLSGLPSRRVLRLSINTMSADEDTLSCVVDRTRYIYSVSGDTVRYEGFENNLSDIMADRAENVLIFPIQLNNIFSCDFSGSGRYADHLRQQMPTQCRSCADACGMLITPEGDTIPNVLRLRTVHDVAQLPVAMPAVGSSSSVRRSVTDYCGPYVYEDSLLSRINLEGGYLSYTDNAGNRLSEPEYHYYLTDHLGNNRVDVTDDGGVSKGIKRR